MFNLARPTLPVSQTFVVIVDVRLCRCRCVVVQMINPERQFLLKSPPFKDRAQYAVQRRSLV